MDILALVHQCTPPNVSAYTMQQIVKVESNAKPFSIGFKLIKKYRVLKDGVWIIQKQVHTLSSQPKSTAEAIQWARYLDAEGYEFDAGIAQIHSTNFGKYGLTIESVFDACTNIRLGANILHECYERALKYFKVPERALPASISCYQSGNFSTGFSTGYVNKVISARVVPPH